jgi:hypothetical protein
MMMAYLIVLPFALVDFWQACPNVDLVQLTLLPRTNDALPLVILERMLQKVTDALDALVALKAL